MSSIKPLSDNELEAWEASRDISAEMEMSVCEMLAGQGAEVPISPVVSARMKSGLSQARFAALFGGGGTHTAGMGVGPSPPIGRSQDTHRHCPEAPRSAQRTGWSGFGGLTRMALTLAKTHRHTCEIEKLGGVKIRCFRPSQILRGHHFQSFVA